MPGTLIRDALAPNLLAGSTLTAAGTTNGTIVVLDRPHMVTTYLSLEVLPTGTTPTISVRIQGSSSATFASDVVDYITLAVLTGTPAQQFAAGKRAGAAYVDRKYVRAIVTLGGTSPVYTGATLTLEQPHFRRLRTTGNPTASI